LIRRPDQDREKKEKEMSSKPQQITNGKLSTKSGILTSFVRATRQVVRGFLIIFDRTNPTIKSVQDVGINLSIFIGAVFAMHRYGAKLSV
jgi:hypothetical protein